MASPQQQPPTKDTLIAIKVYFDGSTRRFKLPLGDLTPTVLPNKLRSILGVNADEEVIFRRYSDSANGFVTLDSENVPVWKSLYRAAKAKLKLRMNATVPGREAAAQTETPTEPTGSAQPSTISPEETTPSTQTLPSSRSSVRTEPDFFRRQLAQHIEQRRRQSQQLDLALRMKQAAAPVSLPYTSWSVYCNHCDKAMENEHYHCSVCDSGDYDLCETCVAAGVHCPGEGHWLIKRFVANGKVINSMTQKVAPRILPKVETETVKDMPGAFTEEKQPETEKVRTSTASQSNFSVPADTRTCNNCIGEFPEHMLVTCMDCPDFDLCQRCHLGNNHGHHPAHVLEPVDPNSASASVKSLCGENHGIKHNAICDGCDSVIYGVRHKCLNCPDWDYCSQCVKNASVIHPLHRFTKIYEKLPDPRQVSVRHTGIYCDGPLCKDKTRSYVEGIRYKCAVCHDTDFCANCEASPVNRHNRTHPLIKFKTPVRNVSVTTMNEDREGSPIATLGDKASPRRSPTTRNMPANLPAYLQNAASAVQTIYETKPSAEPSSSKANSKIDIKDLLTGNEQDPLEKLREQVSKVAISEPVKTTPVRASELNAVFVRDSVPDGTNVNANQRFLQSWTLRNPGPHAWPVGCSVRFVGGDHMLNVDDGAGIEYNRAAESNILAKPIQPGEQVDFRVLMKAPQRSGAAISYWRLKNAEGEAFGHKLWCHVIVKDNVPGVNPPPYSYSAAPCWPAMTPQQQAALRQFNSVPPTQRFEAYRNYVSETRARLSQQYQSSPSPAPAPAPAPADVPLPEKKEAEAEKPKAKAEEKPQETESTTEEVAEKKSESGSSTMIFPTLEKESPVTSIHEAEPSTSTATEAQAPAAATVTSPLPSSVAASEAASEAAETELFEDAETVDMIDSSSDSEGFVTDEEWDVLGASDEETM